MGRPKKKVTEKENLEKKIFNHKEPNIDKIGGCGIRFNELTKFIREDVIEKIDSMSTELDGKISETRIWLRHIKFPEVANVINSGLYLTDELRKTHKELLRLYNKCFADMQEKIDAIEELSKEKDE